MGELADGLAPVVLVIGSNGKTTTTRLVATIIERATGVRPVSNRSGANLGQGIVTALLADRSSSGERRPAVFEVDEMAFPAVAKALRPQVIVITNLVRDQLDRYGEVDSVERRWTQALPALPSTTRLLICADDPRLESVVRVTDLPVLRFGLVPDAVRHRADDHDRRPYGVGAPCPQCGARTAVGDASPILGPWRCTACGTSRQPLDLGVGFDETGPSSLALTFHLGVGSQTGEVAGGARVFLSGTAGAHDAAAAVLAAMSVGIAPDTAIGAVDGATPAFGRLEEIAVDGRHVVLTLAKNPSSVAQATEAAGLRRPDRIMVGLGDRPADGRDVSWIWDACLERLATFAPLTLTGDRADDLAIRFKYALGPDQSSEKAVVDRVVDRALRNTLSRVAPGGTVMVVATYTTLLAVRAELVRRGFAPAMPR